MLFNPEHLTKKVNLIKYLLAFLVAISPILYPRTWDNLLQTLPPVPNWPSLLSVAYWPEYAKTTAVEDELSTCERTNVRLRNEYETIQTSLNTVDKNSSLLQGYLDGNRSLLQAIHYWK
jgi:hypothetical protein